MKKESWALILSGMAVLISIACCFIKIEPISYDYMGVLVGILSLLVTVLIGWNIYTFIDIKGTSQRIDKFRTEFEEKIEKSNLKTQFDVKMEIMRIVPILIARQKEDLISSLQFMFKAFHENKDENSFAKMIAREYILQTIMALINSENKSLTSHLINDMKGSLKVEEIEDFLHEFLSYSEEEKQQHYAGMQNVLLELLKAQS
ncbi:MAG: hypothetical protein RSO15_13315 [Bacteroides sp.]|uniref:hypothetical protein n=1 Tax=Bacteroides sp. TaxID=29523 RepID=UPI002FCC78D8